MKLVNPRLVFVLPDSRLEQLESFQLINVDENWQILNDGPYCWILQTFLLLKETNLKVELSTNLQQGCLNFVHSSYAHSLRKLNNEIIIGIRADYPYRSVFDFHIVSEQKPGR